MLPVTPLSSLQPLISHNLPALVACTYKALSALTAASLDIDRLRSSQQVPHTSACSPVTAHAHSFEDFGTAQGASHTNLKSPFHSLPSTSWKTQPFRRFSNASFTQSTEHSTSPSSSHAPALSIQRPSKASVAALVHELSQSLPAEAISQSASELQQHGADESYHVPMPPDVVVWPRTTEEVSSVVAACARCAVFIYHIFYLLCAVYVCCPDMVKGRYLFPTLTSPPRVVVENFVVKMLCPKRQGCLGAQPYHRCLSLGKARMFQIGEPSVATE